MATRAAQTESKVPAESWVGDRLPDPSLFFVGPALGRLLDLVYHLSNNTHDIVLLTGARGAGKTTLLYRIQTDAPDTWLPCRVDANPMMHPDQLFNILAGHTRSAQNADNMPALLLAAFSDLRLQGLHPVVIVDDAEQLPISSLMALLRLHEKRVQDAPPFALIVLAQPVIAQTLESQQLHAMGTTRFHRLELPPIDAGQIGEYIQRFLQVEGIREEIPFRADQLEHIQRESKGLPGRINELVVRTLRHTGHNRQAGWWIKLTRQLRILPPMTTATALAVGLLIGLAMWNPGQINQLFSPAPGDVGDLSKDPLSFQPTGNRPRMKLSASGDALVQTLPLPAAEPESAPTAEDEALDSAPPQLSPDPTPGIPTPQPLAEPLVTEAEPVVEAEAEIPADPAPEHLGQTAPEANQEPQGEPQLEPKPAPAEPSQTMPQEKKSARPQPIPTPIAARPPTGPQRDQWLLLQVPDSWTLQILGGRDEKALQHFMDRHKLKDQAFYFRTRRDNRDWYTLLLGIYPDRAAADKALAKLPKPLRKSGAWPRSLGVIQGQIRKQEH